MRRWSRPQHTGSTCRSTTRRASTTCARSRRPGDCGLGRAHARAAGRPAAELGRRHFARHFADLDLDEELVSPAAFTRTARAAEQDDDTAARRAVGRRRGRSGDRRQWMALGAIAVVAAGAIGGVLMKYVFSGPSGPSHTVVAPKKVDAFTRMANLEKQLMSAGELRRRSRRPARGRPANVVSAVYQQGSLGARHATPRSSCSSAGNCPAPHPARHSPASSSTIPGAQAVLSRVARRCGGLHRDALERRKRGHVRVVRQRQLRRPLCRRR